MNQIFNNLPYANQVSAQDFDSIFTDSLTEDSLSDGTHSNALNILISAEGEKLMYIRLKFENDVRRKALIDTAACAKAMPADFYEKLKTQSPNSYPELQQASLLNMKVASGRTVKVLAQVDIKFKINEHQFDDVFLILPSMKSVVLGNPFFKKYNIEVSPRENLLKLPDMTYHLNEIKNPSRGRKKIPKTKNPLCVQQKIVIQPQQQEILYAKIDVPKILEGHTGIVFPDEEFEESTDLKFWLAVIKVGKDNNISFIAIILNEHNITLAKNKQIAVFQFISPQGEEELIQSGPDLLALDKLKDGEKFNSVNQILSTGKIHGKNQPKRPTPDFVEIWFPTPETCPNLEKLPNLQKKTHDNITKLQQRDTLDPQQNSGDRETFLQQFDWSRSALTATEKCKNW